MCFCKRGEDDVDECCGVVVRVVSCRCCDCCIEVVGEEQSGHWVMWCELEEVDVDVALDSDGGFWEVCEDVIDCCFEILWELWVRERSSVDVDDGMDWVCFSFGAVYLEDDCCCLGDVDVV